MNTIKKILLPTDFSKLGENTLKFAIEIAKRSNAQIIAMHSYYVPVLDLDIPSTMVHEMIEEEKFETEQQLLRICELINNTKGLDGHYLSSDFVSEYGLPISEISRQAKEQEADLIVMGTERYEQFLNINSTTAGVIGHVKCPILIVKENTKLTPLKNIYFALEDVMEDISSIDQLTPIAQLYDADITILHVSNYPENMEELKAFKREKKNHSLLLDELKESHNYSNLDLKNFFGDNSTDGLLNTIKTDNPDCIVLLKYHRNLLENIFHKSITKAMIKNIDLPVIVLHKV